MADNFGVQFWLHDGTALNQIDGVLSLTPASGARSTYKTTDHGTTGGVHTYQGEPLREPGTFTVRIKYLSGSADDIVLLAALADPTPRAYKWVYAPARQITGNAILTDYSVQEMGLEGQQEAILTFQASGAATPAAAS